MHLKSKKPVLLIASNNDNKVKELRRILKGIGFTIAVASDIDEIDKVEESGSTFEENAILKARSIVKKKHVYVFSDDSGLEVEALNNRPGVYSARYAGINATDRQRINKLLEEMQYKTNRRARFVCVIAIATPEGNVMTFKGEIYGNIVSSPTGTKGFGYDPIFQPIGYKETFAELDPKIKNKISHRAIATNKALVALNKLKVQSSKCN